MSTKRCVIRDVYVLNVGQTSDE